MRATWALRGFANRAWTVGVHHLPLPTSLSSLQRHQATAASAAAPKEGIRANRCSKKSGTTVSSKLNATPHHSAPTNSTHPAHPPKDGEEVFHPEARHNGQGQTLAPFMDAVIKVYCVHTEPNYSLPWQRKRQQNSTSSGFIAMFNGTRVLLTNAHSVDYHTQVKVKRRGDDRKFLAKVLSIGVDCDVALLTVEAEEFWSGVSPLEFGPLPKLQDAVAVVGYPIGGDTISVTAGVVSRIEVTDYSHGSMDLLSIQIDAAINGGNSGGPVFNAQGQCCGIAFQALVGSDVENVGYVIPTPVVSHFLTDYERTKKFTGFPALGIKWQRMESDALKRAYGMTKGQKGVLIRCVNPTSNAAAHLKEDDVILAFDGIEIASDGTVPFRTGERIAFSYLISTKFVGDECTLKALRAGKTLETTFKLNKPHALVPAHISNKDPSYFIVAGLVFTPVCEPYLQSEYGSDYASESPVRILDRLFSTLPKEADEEVVVLSQVLACDATLGYEDIYNVQVLKFNGVPVRHLRHLAEMVVACTDRFMRFDLEYDEVVVLLTEDVHKATPDVVAAHSLPALLSADLRKAGLTWPPVEASTSSSGTA